MAPLLSIADFRDMLRRRFWVIFLVTVLGTAATVLLLLQQRHEYMSTEVIQIAQPVIADDLARTTVEGSAARRLQLIEQRLMSRGTILELIEQNGLYDDLPALRDSEKVALFRRSVGIDGVAAAGRGLGDEGTISILRISARMPSPELAQRIAREMGQRTIELSNENRIIQARETLAFFDEQESTVSAEISSLEAEIAAFREENQLSLPGSLEFRREEVSTINDGLLEISRERVGIEREIELAQKNQRPATAARMRTSMLEDIETLEAQRSVLLERKREIETLIETGPLIEKSLSAFERQLDQLRTELEQISGRRTEAEMGFRLEAERQAERLMVIEEAIVPDYPVSSSRKKKAVLGMMVSMVAGLAAALLLELRKPVIRSALQMERELGLQPAVIVPVLDPRKEARRNRKAGRGQAKAV